MTDKHGTSGTKGDAKVGEVKDNKDPKDNTPEADKGAMDQKEALKAGAVQVTEDKDGAQFARVPEADGMRTENMPTQAQVNAITADKLQHNPDEGIVTQSVDGSSETRIWPMKALTHVAVGLNTYGPGQYFNVGDVDTRNYLIESHFAEDRKYKASEDPRKDDPSRYATDSHLTT